MQKFKLINQKVPPDAFVYFKNNGYLIIEDVLDNEEVLIINNKVDELISIEKKNKTIFEYGENLTRIWNLVNKDILFQNLITSAYILEFADYAFDRDTNHLKYYLSSFQANILGPGAKAQNLHIDTPVPDPLPSWEIKINSIWLLNDFTDKNGATQIIPQSHKFGRRPNKNNVNDYEGLVDVIAKKGSILFTRGYLWHRSGNQLTSIDRRVLLGSFAASYMREISSEEDILSFQAKNNIVPIQQKCWELVGGQHGIK
jgi:ectoine hydroxylase-related dioxygenase (phytanoyl-CoA dioxygenase family)